MKYLLDTCCVSDFVKGCKNTLTHIKNKSPSDLAVSSITVMEIHYGLLHNPQRAKKITKVIEAFLSSIVILDFAYTDAYHAAEIRTQLKKEGTPIGSYDILIAGTAIRYALTLVTSNEKEFSHIAQLPIENWRQ